MCVHRCPVCVAPLPACSLARDGWVWVPLTAPGPALFWGSGLVPKPPPSCTSLDRKAGESPQLLLSSFSALTSNIFISRSWLGWVRRDPSKELSLF